MTVQQQLKSRRLPWQVTRKGAWERTHQNLPVSAAGARVGDFSHVCQPDAVHRHLPRQKTAVGVAGGAPVGKTFRLEGLMRHPGMSTASEPTNQTCEARNSAVCASSPSSAESLKSSCTLRFEKETLGSFSRSLVPRTLRQRHIRRPWPRGQAWGRAGAAAAGGAAMAARGRFHRRQRRETAAAGPGNPGEPSLEVCPRAPQPALAAGAGMGARRRRRSERPPCSPLPFPRKERMPKSQNSRKRQ